MLDMSLPFRYKPLRSSVSTRLVQIQPGSGSGVVVDLIEAFPNGPLKYDALSYTWGENTKEKFIICNGRRLSITENLHKALKRFRDHDQVITMWIDQLCIDQENIRERNRQVSLMGKIYMAAHKVIVWLGEDTPYREDGAKLDLKPGLSLMRQILYRLQDDPELRFNWSSMVDSPGLPKAGNKQWQALAAILRRPWFMRMWVIQEVVLSSNIEVACGHAIFTWEEMGQIVSYLDCEEYRKWNVRNPDLVTELPFSRINRIKRLNEQSGRPALFDLMLACRDFGASDSRDKIYALLELGQHDITPDYSMSTRDVFVDFAMSTIKSAQQPRFCCANGVNNPNHFDCCAQGWKDQEKFHRVMTMLCCAGSLSQQLSLPSWVPDWSLNPKVRPLCFWGSKDHRAGGSTLGELCLRENGRLSVPGKLYDTVRLAGSVNLNLANIADPKVERALISEWQAECDFIAARAHLPYPMTGETSRDVLQRILRDNDIGERTQPRGHHGRSSGNLIDDLANPLWVLPDNHYTSTMGIAVGRVLILTSSGYMGLAPHGTRDGDVVFVMLGCDIPLTLRPSGDEFILLGECFVQGIMDGEVTRDDNIAVRDITIT